LAAMVVVGSVQVPSDRERRELNFPPKPPGRVAPWASAGPLPARGGAPAPVQKKKTRKPGQAGCSLAARSQPCTRWPCPTSDRSPSRWPEMSSGDTVFDSFVPSCHHLAREVARDLVGDSRARAPRLTSSPGPESADRRLTLYRHVPATRPSATWSPELQALDGRASSRVAEGSGSRTSRVDEVKPGRAACFFKLMLTPPTTRSTRPDPR
jgi:hypothetical protein